MEFVVFIDEVSFPALGSVGWLERTIEAARFSAPSLKFKEDYSILQCCRAMVLFSESVGSSVARDFDKIFGIASRNLLMLNFISSIRRKI
jgi:hypothetical protein